MNGGLLLPPLNGIQIITNPYLTETKHTTLKRRFAPGKRRGRHKGTAVKVYHLPSITLPSNKVLYIEKQRVAVVHPTRYNQLVDIMTNGWPSTWTWGADDITQAPHMTRRR